MAVGCKLFGDWDKITQLGSRMQTAVLQAGERLLESIGEDLEGTVRGHMQSQDLGWPPLKPKTLAAKNCNEKRHLPLSSNTGCLRRY